MKVAVIGGGASGLVCAISAAEYALKNNIRCEITVFEAKDRVGKKLLATGNGRCNMLNTDQSPFYFSQNDFHSFAMSKFDFKSNIQFFEKLGLYTRQDDEGRVYPLSNQASTVLDILRLECDNLNIKTVTDCNINSIKKVNDGFSLNGNMSFDKVVLAVGGKAAVKNFNGYDLLSQLGHKVTRVTPSLTKLNVSDTTLVKQLQGIRHKAVLTLTVGGKHIAKEKGELLFAKYGLSGIAVMQLSAYITRFSKNDGEAVIYADFVPDYSFEFIKTALEERVKHNKNLENGNLLLGFMPKKLGEAVMKDLGFDLKQVAENLGETQINKLVSKIKKYPFVINSVLGFEEAQVTAGGADTKYFNSKTMESTIHKGFYAVGEVLDVDGLCGGYNLMWAWSSGRLCGENLIKQHLKGDKK